MERDIEGICLTGWCIPTSVPELRELARVVKQGCSYVIEC